MGDNGSEIVDIIYDRYYQHIKEKGSPPKYLILSCDVKEALEKHVFEMLRYTSVLVDGRKPIYFSGMEILLKQDYTLKDYIEVI